MQNASINVIERARGALSDDTLIGNHRPNTLIGGPGNDTYWVFYPDDDVIEHENEGLDRVHAWVDFSLPPHVEILILEGDGDLEATGNDLDNVIAGNAGNNVIRGGGGDDILMGGRRRNILTGDGGANTFRIINPGFGEDADIITDFNGNLADLNAGRGDRVEISLQGFGLASDFQDLVWMEMPGGDMGWSIRWAEVYSREEELVALKNSTHYGVPTTFIINRPEGRLIFNENGAAPGAGNGGLFATLQRDPSNPDIGYVAPISWHFVVIDLPDVDDFTYAAWRAGLNLVGPDAEPDRSFIGDGVPNLVKYALGLDPRVPVQGDADFAALSIENRISWASGSPDPTPHAVFRFRRHLDRADLRHDVLIARDWDQWETLADEPDPERPTENRLEPRRAMIPLGDTGFFRLHWTLW